MSKRNAHKPATVRRGRFGMNAETLAGMTAAQAVKAFKKVPEHLVKDAHAEAVKMKKDAEKAEKAEKAEAAE